MPKICYNKWHKPETEETLCPDPKNADASVPCPDAAASAPWRGQRTLEEYETIRLIDLLECTQEECAAQMGVARSTVQQVYDTARRRLAQALVEGRRLHISGGDYVLCPRGEECPGRDCARRDCGMGRCGCGACLRSKEN